MLARYYDVLVDWDQRLRRETPFLKKLLLGRRVLVAACGTGGHLPALLAEGYEVAGIDADPEMVERARAKGGRVEALRLEECSALGENFDAVLCLGNVLPNLDTNAAIVEMYRVLAAGGVFFTQNLNYDRRWREKARFFPLLSGRLEGEEVILFKFADYGGSWIDFHAVFLVRRGQAGQWESTIETTRQRPVFRKDLEQACRLAGFRKIETWGGYGGEPFDAEQSSDLLLAAWK
jgi:SAM-dependent methyltransferase